VGEEAIQRISGGLGLRVVAPILFQAVDQFSSNATSWKHRRAAVAAVSRLSSGTTTTFVKAYFETSTQFLLRSLSDPCQIVRYEAVDVSLTKLVSHRVVIYGSQALGVFAELFTEKLPELIKSVMPALVSILMDCTACEKLKGHAASGKSYSPLAVSI
jgi:hypothetical protein